MTTQQDILAGRQRGRRLAATQQRPRFHLTDASGRVVATATAQKEAVALIRQRPELTLCRSRDVVDAPRARDVSEALRGIEAETIRFQSAQEAESLSFASTQEALQRREEAEAAVKLNLREVGVNRGIFDTAIDLVSGAVRTVRDFIEVPEVPTRQSFTPLSFDAPEPRKRVIPWGALNMIIDPSGDIEWEKADKTADKPKHQDAPLSGRNALKTQRRRGGGL